MLGENNQQCIFAEVLEERMRQIVTVIVVVIILEYSLESLSFVGIHTCHQFFSLGPQLLE